MTMGSRIIGDELAKLMVKTWLDSEFQGGGSTSKVDRINAIDKEFSKEN